MARDTLRKLWGLLDPSRFPRTSDAVLNGVVVIAALGLGAGSALLGRTRPRAAFTAWYEALLPRPLIVTYRDCEFTVRPGHGEVWQLMPQSEAYALDYFTPSAGDIVVDIGAHVGKYTVPSADRVGPSGHVYAFEPLAENFSALEANLARNDLSEFVTAENRAAFDEPGEMWLVDWNLRREPAPEAEAGHRHHQGQARVEAVVLDDYLADREVETVDFVKIDVEREGLAVLEGLTTILRRSEDVTLLLEVFEEDYDETSQLLAGLGFAEMAVEGPGWPDNGLRDFVFVK